MRSGTTTFLGTMAYIPHFASWNNDLYPTLRNLLPKMDTSLERVILATNYFKKNHEREFHILDGAIKKYKMLWRNLLERSSTHGIIIFRSLSGKGYEDGRRIGL